MATMVIRDYAIDKEITGFGCLRHVRRKFAEVAKLRVQNLYLSWRKNVGAPLVGALFEAFTTSGRPYDILENQRFFTQSSEILNLNRL